MHVQLAEDLKLDLTRLIATRLLVQANSGGGKSYLLRLLAEQTIPHAQTIILDSEGEYASLRELHDLLIVGEGGDLPASVESAALLARRLCDLRVSAVVDIYGLTLDDRRAFVRHFIEALMSVKQQLWHPLLLLLDEAQKFAPERGAGDSEATEAVITLMTQGRKRGFCGVIATQRLSKLHKDVAAECNNVLIGRTWLDVDQVRASDLLGLNKTSRTLLRDLQPGEFYGFGPALSRPGVTRFCAGQVRTTHPQAGHTEVSAPPAPSGAIKAIVAELSDLPQQAQVEARTLATAQERITQLEREVAALKKSQGAPVVDKATIQRALAEYARQIEASQRAATEALNRQLAEVRRRCAKLSEALAGVTASVERIEPNFAFPALSANLPASPVSQTKRPAKTPPVRKSTDSDLGAGQRKILTVLAQHQAGRSAVQVALLTDYSHQGGGFRNYLGALRSRGFIAGGGDCLTITDTGLEALGDYVPLPTGRALIEYWCGQLPKAASLILGCLLESYPRQVVLSVEEVASRTGYEATGGGFRNALGRLRTLELIEGRGDLKASDVFFED